MKFSLTTVIVFFVSIASIQSEKVEIFGRIENQIRLGSELVLADAIPNGSVGRAVSFPKVS